MVSRGRPSKGCHRCRARKIACDQARPSCLQCERGGSVCPGYHDTWSLMFRDESRQVIRKAAADSSRRKPKSTTRARDVGTSETRPVPTSNALQPQSSTVLKSNNNNNNDNDNKNISLFRQGGQINQLVAIQPSYQPSRDEAISWFLRHNSWPGALFMIDFSPDVLAQTNLSLGESARVASLVAIGTAMLSRVRRSEVSAQLKQVAVREYGRALSLLSHAVTHGMDCKSNATLSAVLLLALFEVITNGHMSTSGSWTKHIHGASALMEMRGDEELQDPEGMNLFLQLRFQIIISCLQTGLHVPKSLLETNKTGMNLRPQMEAYCDRVIYITGQLANVRADILKGILTDTGEILSHAYSMEADLVSWVASAPPQFLYTTIEHPPLQDWTTTSGCTPSLYNSRYHVYHDLWICHTWNQYRYSRILICEIIIGCLRRISGPTGIIPGKDLQRQCTVLRGTSRELALDICASAAYHLGAGGLGNCSGIPASQTYIGAMLLLWPFVVAGATEMRGHPMRLWVMECLKLVGHAMGIDQAFAVREILESEAGYFDDIDERDGGIVFLDTDQTRHNQFIIGTWSSIQKAR